MGDETTTSSDDEMYIHVMKDKYGYSTDVDFNQLSDGDKIEGWQLMTGLLLEVNEPAELLL